MSDRWIKRVLLVAALAVLLGTALPALAQETQEEPGEPPMTEQEQAVEDALKRQPFAGEITVTSRRREENIQEVPVAISVVPGEALEDVVASDISTIQAYVPNTSIYQGRNQSTTMTVFIRGVGQADPLWGVDPGVGLYFDDVYIARPQGALLDVFDVERVEVLRGPQGTLYGKNTIGGAIKYVSRPLTDTWQAKVSATAGSFSTQEFKASIGGPLVEGKLRMRAAFALLQRDGYGRNLNLNTDVSNKDTTAFRLALEWLPSDKVSLLAAYTGTRDDAAPVGLTRLQENPFCAIFYGEACPPLPNNFDTMSGLTPLNGTDSDGYSLTLTWNINDAWTFKSITAYRDSYSDNAIDFDTTPLRITDVSASYWDDQTTQEFQLLYTGDRLSGVVGFYYFDGFAGGFVPNIFFGDTAIESFRTSDGDTKTKSYAIFFDGGWRITDNLTFNFGLRPTRETKQTRAYNVRYLDDDFDPDEVILIDADFDKEATFESLAPKLGLDYRFNPDVMGYVTLSRGFKSGGFNVRANEQALPETADPFDDEVLTMAEVGLKTVLANKQLVLNTAVFYGDYTDVQVSTFTSFDSNGDGEDDSFLGDFKNAGDATVQGVEVEYNWASASWFGLSGYVSYLDASPDTFLDEDEDGFVDTQVITNAPEWTGSLRANVDFPLFGGLITGSVGYSYRDDSVLTNEGGTHPYAPGVPLLPMVQPAFGLVDAWVSWLSRNSHWRFGIVGKNLTDEAYLTNGYNLPVVGVHQGSYAMPRTIVGTVEFRFF